MHKEAGSAVLVNNPSIAIWVQWQSAMMLQKFNKIIGFMDSWIEHMCY